MATSISTKTPIGKAQRLKFILILGSLSAFGPLSIDMYLPALPTLAQNLNTTQPLAQLSLMACLLGLALGQLIAGPLSDIRGRRMPLIVALVLYTIASLACALASSIWVLIALRLVQGAAGAAGIVISRATVRDLYAGKELTQFFTMLMLVNGLAPILAPIFGGFILNFVDWRGVFWVLCVIGGMMLLAVMFALPETLERERRSSGGLGDTLRTFGKLLRNRAFIGYALCQAFVMAAMFAYISGSPFVIQDLFGVSPQGYSWFFAINGLGIVLFSQITGRLVYRVGESRLLVTGLLIAVISGISLMVLTWIGGGLWSLAPFLFLIVASVGMLSSTTTSLAMQSQEPRTAGSASALIGLMPLLFGAGATPLVGLGSGTTAFPMGLVIGIAELLALISYLIFVLPASRSKSFS
ncbi:Bcr/CflA family multidrug efflux MFS transporter [Saccharibacillus sp. JS10]|uniref:Bcr/CflA family multidrug efflux MFS transporter n=1 Tax=Saccharibacillus sp. JS10 TaxID=2950552 RepID=UPI00210CC6BE|nr:Bcr/CflA family multidrug efflux MFS transporter [Saccharibacillus sp. JS10]MCQ4085558.1 Bcr/CflA family multidrug efflux MFS transporter [Saccharibacillus sp. JS10]